MPTKLEELHEATRIPDISDTVEKLYCSHRGRAETSAYPLIRDHYDVYRSHLDILPDHVKAAEELGVEWNGVPKDRRLTMAEMSLVASAF